ncbi:hypothetical protein MRB53_041476 [Persea americana]|nr:hypothetical protein MRB53_041476 [Persea americana]
MGLRKINRPQARLKVNKLCGVPTKTYRYYCRSIKPHIPACRIQGFESARAAFGLIVILIWVFDLWLMRARSANKYHFIMFPAAEQADVPNGRSGEYNAAPT